MIDWGAVLRRTPTAWNPNRTLGEQAPTLSAEAVEAVREVVPREAEVAAPLLQAVEYVVQHATTRDLQDQCMAALIKKAEILWHLLDCLHMDSVERGQGLEIHTHDQLHRQATA